MSDAATDVRVLLLVAVVGLMLSLGPQWTLWGRTVTAPFAALFEHVPGFRAIRFPARFGVFAIFGAIGLGGVALARALPARFALDRVVPLLLALAAIVELKPGPVELREIRDPFERKPGLSWLADRRDGGAVVHLPFRGGGKRVKARIDDDAMRMFAALRHRHPIVNGMSGFQPPLHAVLEEALRRFPNTEAERLLDNLGVRYVHVDGAYFSDEELARLDAWVGGRSEEWRVAFRSDGDRVWERVQPRPPPGEPPPEPALSGSALPADCQVEATVGDPAALVDFDEGVRWTTDRAQRGGEAITVRCAAPLALSCFVLELGPHLGDYPRGLRVEAEGAPVLDVPDATPYAQLVHRPSRRWVGRFPERAAREWKLIQTAESAGQFWSIAELRVCRGP